MMSIPIKRQILENNGKCADDVIEKHAKKT